jgi:arabinose-5-phosphate isomerase
MTAGGQSISAEALAVNALETLRKHNISQLIVTADNQYLGILHLHDLVKEGII